MIAARFMPHRHTYRLQARRYSSALIVLDLKRPISFRFSSQACSDILSAGLQPVSSAVQGFRHLLQDLRSGERDGSSGNMRKPCSPAFLSTRSDCPQKGKCFSAVIPMFQKFLLVRSPELHPMLKLAAIEVALFVKRAAVVLINCTVLLGDYTQNLIFDASIFPNWYFVIILPCFISDFYSCPLQGS